MWQYQFGQSPSYIKEHLPDDGDYEIMIYQQSNDLIRDQFKLIHNS